MEIIKVKNKNIRIILSEVLLNSAFIIHQILNWKVAYGVLVLDSLPKYQPIKYQCCPQIETSQLICTSNPLTGFYIIITGIYWVNNQIQLETKILTARCRERYGNFPSSLSLAIYQEITAKHENQGKYVSARLKYKNLFIYNTKNLFIRNHFFTLF